MTQPPDKETSPPPAAPVFQTLDRCASYPYKKSDYIKRLLWNLTQATLFRYSLPRAFGWRRWLLRSFGAQIGENTYFRAGSRVFHPWLLTVGEWSTISGGVIIYNLGHVHIGSHTVISQDAYICAGTHDYTKPDLPLLRPEIRIGSGIWIAAAAFIGPGVTIGDNSVIGARAVVTKNIPPGVVAAGNPAAVIKPRKMIQTPESA